MADTVFKAIMADPVVQARLVALKAQWDQRESMSAEAKQQCFDELSQLFAQFERTRDAAKEKAAELIPQLMTRLREIDAEMLELGALCRDGGNIYAFPSHWVNREEYRVWVETAKCKIEKHKAHIHQINELKHHTQVQIDQLENGDNIRLHRLKRHSLTTSSHASHSTGRCWCPNLKVLWKKKESSFTSCGCSSAMDMPQGCALGLTMSLLRAKEVCWPVACCYCGLKIKHTFHALVME